MDITKCETIPGLCNIFALVESMSEDVQIQVGGLVRAAKPTTQPTKPSSVARDAAVVAREAAIKRTATLKVAQTKSKLVVQQKAVTTLAKKVLAKQADTVKLAAERIQRLSAVQKKVTSSTVKKAISEKAKSAVELEKAISSRIQSVAQKSIAAKAERAAVIRETVRTTGINRAVTKVVSRTNEAHNAHHIRINNAVANRSRQGLQDAAGTAAAHARIEIPKTNAKISNAGDIVRDLKGSVANRGAIVKSLDANTAAGVNHTTTRDTAATTRDASVRDADATGRAAYDANVAAGNTAGRILTDSSTVGGLRSHADGVATGRAKREPPSKADDSAAARSRDLDAAGSSFHEATGRKGQTDRGRTDAADQVIRFDSAEGGATVRRTGAEGDVTAARGARRTEIEGAVGLANIRARDTGDHLSGATRGRDSQQDVVRDKDANVAREEANAARNREEITRAEGDLTIARDAVRDAKGARDAAGENIRSANREIKNLKQGLRDVNQRIAEARKATDEGRPVRDNVDALMATRDQLGASLKGKQAQLRDARNASRESNRLLQQRTRDLDAATARLDNIRTERGQRADAAIDMPLNRDGIKQDLDSYSGTNKTVQDKLTTQRESLQKKLGDAGGVKNYIDTHMILGKKVTKAETDRMVKEARDRASNKGETSAAEGVFANRSNAESKGHIRELDGSVRDLQTSGGALRGERDSAGRSLDGEMTTASNRATTRDGAGNVRDAFARDADAIGRSAYDSSVAAGNTSARIRTDSSTVGGLRSRADGVAMAREKRQPPSRADDAAAARSRDVDDAGGVFREATGHRGRINEGRSNAADQVRRFDAAEGGATARRTGAEGDVAAARAGRRAEVEGTVGSANTRTRNAGDTLSGATRAKDLQGNVVRDKDASIVREEGNAVRNREDITRAEGDLAIARDAVRDAKGARDAAGENIRAANRDIKSIKQGLREVNQKLAEARKAVEEGRPVRDSVEALVARRDQLGASLKDAQGRLRDARNASGEANRLLQQRTRDLDAATTRLEQVRSDAAIRDGTSRDLNANRGDVEGTNALYKEIKPEFDAKVEKLSADLNALKAHMETVAMRIETFRIQRDQGIGPKEARQNIEGQQTSAQLKGKSSSTEGAFAKRSQTESDGHVRQLDGSVRDLQNSGGTLRGERGSAGRSLDTNAAAAPKHATTRDGAGNVRDAAVRDADATGRSAYDANVAAGNTSARIRTDSSTVGGLRSRADGVATARGKRQPPLKADDAAAARSRDVDGAGGAFRDARGNRGRMNEGRSNAADQARRFDAAEGGATARRTGAEGDVAAARGARRAEVDGTVGSATTRTRNAGDKLSGAIKDGDGQGNVVRDKDANVVREEGNAARNREDITRAEGDLAIARDAVRDAKAARDAAGENIRAANRDIKNIKEGLRDVNQKLAEARKAVEEGRPVRDSVEALVARRDQVGASLKDAQGRLRDARNASGEANRLLEQRTRDLDAATTRLEQVRSDAAIRDGTSRDLNANRDGVEGINAYYKDTKPAFDTKIEKLSAELNAVKAHMETVAMRIETFRIQRDQGIGPKEARQNIEGQQTSAQLKGKSSSTGGAFAKRSHSASALHVRKLDGSVRDLQTSGGALRGERGSAGRSFDATTVAAPKHGTTRDGAGNVRDAAVRDADATGRGAYDANVAAGNTSARIRSYSSTVRGLRGNVDGVATARGKRQPPSRADDAAAARSRDVDGAGAAFREATGRMGQAGRGRSDAADQVRRFDAAEGGATARRTGAEGDVVAARGAQRTEVDGAVGSANVRAKDSGDNLSSATKAGDGQGNVVRDKDASIAREEANALRNREDITRAEGDLAIARDAVRDAKGARDAAGENIRAANRDIKNIKQGLREVNQKLAEARKAVEEGRPVRDSVDALMARRNELSTSLKGTQGRLRDARNASGEANRLLEQRTRDLDAATTRLEQVRSDAAIRDGISRELRTNRDDVEGTNALYKEIKPEFDAKIKKLSADLNAVKAHAETVAMRIESLRIQRDQGIGSKEARQNIEGQQISAQTKGKSSSTEGAFAKRSQSESDGHVRQLDGSVRDLQNSGGALRGERGSAGRSLDANAAAAPKHATTRDGAGNVRDALVRDADATGRSAQDANVAAGNTSARIRTDSSTVGGLRSRADGVAMARGKRQRPSRADDAAAARSRDVDAAGGAFREATGRKGQAGRGRSDAAEQVRRFDAAEGGATARRTGAEGDVAAARAGRRAEVDGTVGSATTRTRNAGDKLSGAIKDGDGQGNVARDKDANVAREEANALRNREDITRAEGEVSVARDAVRDAKAARDAAGENIRNANREIKNIKQGLREVNQRIAEARKAVEEGRPVRDSVDALMARRDQLSTSLKGTQGRLRDARNASGEANRLLQERTRDLDAATTRLEQVRSETAIRENTSAELRANRDGVEGTNAYYKETKPDFDAKIEKLSADLNALKAHAETVALRIESLRIQREQGIGPKEARQNIEGQKANASLKGIDASTNGAIRNHGRNISEGHVRTSETRISDLQANGSKLRADRNSASELSSTNTRRPPEHATTRDSANVARDQALRDADSVAAKAREEGANADRTADNIRTDANRVNQLRADADGVATTRAKREPPSRADDAAANNSRDLTRNNDGHADGVARSRNADEGRKNASRDADDHAAAEARARDDVVAREKDVTDAEAAQTRDVDGNVQDATTRTREAGELLRDAEDGSIPLRDDADAAAARAREDADRAAKNKKDLDDAADAVKRAKEDVDAAKKAHDDSVKDLSDAQKNAKKLEKEVASLKKDMDAALKRAQEGKPLRAQEINALRAKSEQLRKQLDDANTTIKNAKKKIEEARAKIEEAKKRLKDAEENLKKERERIKRDNEELAKRRKNSEEDADAIKKRQDEEQAMRDKIERILAALTSIMSLLTFFFPPRLPPDQPPPDDVPEDIGDGYEPPPPTEPTEDGYTPGDSNTIIIPPDTAVVVENVVCDTGSDDYIDGCMDGNEQGMKDGVKDGANDEYLFRDRILPFTSTELDLLTKNKVSEMSRTQVQAFCTNIMNDLNQDKDTIVKIIPACSILRTSSVQTGGASSVVTGSPDYVAGYAYSYNKAYISGYNAGWAVAKATKYVPESGGYGDYGDYGEKPYGEKPYGEKDYGEKDYGDYGDYGPSQRGGRIQSFKRHVKRSKNEYLPLLEKIIGKTIPV